MAKLSRLISRGALALMLLASLLCSAGCGCGGRTTGPPPPDYDRGYYPHAPFDDYYPGRPYYPDKDKEISRLGQYVLRELRLTGASFIEGAESSRVVNAATLDGMEQFGRALYYPQAAPGWPAPENVSATAYAIYGFSSFSFREPAYIETYWGGLAPDDGNLFIGVWRYAHGRWLWTWYSADNFQRVRLDYLGDYRSLDSAQTIYVTVLVSGSRVCALDGIALRQYRRQ